MGFEVVCVLVALSASLRGDPPASDGPIGSLSPVTTPAISQASATTDSTTTVAASASLPVEAVKPSESSGVSDIDVRQALTPGAKASIASETEPLGTNDRGSSSSPSADPVAASAGSPSLDVQVTLPPPSPAASAGLSPPRTGTAALVPDPSSLPGLNSELELAKKAENHISALAKRKFDMSDQAAAGEGRPPSPSNVEDTPLVYHMRGLFAVDPPKTAPPPPTVAAAPWVPSSVTQPPAPAMRSFVSHDVIFNEDGGGGKQPTAMGGLTRAQMGDQYHQTWAEARINPNSPDSRSSFSIVSSPSDSSESSSRSSDSSSSCSSSKSSQSNFSGETNQSSAYTSYFSDVLMSPSQSSASSLASSGNSSQSSGGSSDAGFIDASSNSITSSSVAPSSNPLAFGSSSSSSMAFEFMDGEVASSKMPGMPAMP